MKPRAEWCSVHTHSTLCDGKFSLEEMAAAACGAGVRYFGASGHSHTPIPRDQGNVLAADPAEYCQELLRLREVYAGRMEILMGIEQDSCASAAVPEWAEYWIGSVHNLPDPARAELWWPVDWDAEKLERGCREGFGGDMTALVKAYYRAVGEAAERRPTILGHLDLITKLNAGGRFFDETADWYRRLALEALDRADPEATLLEINTGAIARGYRTEPYPALFLLRAWRERGGRIILTADAHSRDAVIFGYDLARAAALAAGFWESVLLTRQGGVACPLEE